MNFACHFCGFKNIGEEITRLNVFENMVLRKVFGPTIEDVIVVWRRMHILYLLLCITSLVKSSRRK